MVGAATAVDAPGFDDPRHGGTEMRRVNDRTMVLTFPGPISAHQRTDPWGEHLATTNPALRRSRWWSSAVPALVMAAVGAIGLSGPALWTDELQSWGMSITPIAQLWPIVRWVDAVLAPYYVVLWGWTHVAGDSDIAVRIPSVVAMAGAAGLIGALGGRMAGPPAGPPPRLG